ncbi:MAG: flagellar filament capping protein FliD [Terriglobales bacterium]|jgi:flagellar hook-associated protein 2
MGISFNAASLLNGNGINVSSVVSEIQSAESGQLTAWQGDMTTLQTQASDLNSMNTDLSNLATAVTALSDPVDGVMSEMSATSSESAIVGATAQNGATAGNYTVVVSSLASTGTLYTDEVANANTSILPSGQSSGDLQLQIGGSGGTTADVAITAGSNDTLTTLAASINSQSTANNWGITANVVTDASGSRLAIYSQASGSTGALAVTNNTTSMTFEPPVGGTNAEISVNGIPYASTTNTVTGAIPDVTLNLVTGDPDTPVTVAVGADSTDIANAIQSFVSAYNQVIGDINSQFTVNAATNQEGPLGSDSAVRMLQSSLLNDVTYTTSDSLSESSGINSLAALGITMNNDGTLSLNSSTLSSALTSNPAAVQNFFQNSNMTGFANSLNTSLSSLSAPTTGILSLDLTQNQTQQSALTSEISDFQAQMASQQTALDQEFDQVNANLEQYPYTLLEVTAALGSLSGNSSTTTSNSNSNTTPTSGTATS